MKRLSLYALGWALLPLAGPVVPRQNSSTCEIKDLHTALKAPSLPLRGVMIPIWVDGDQRRR